MLLPTRQSLLVGVLVLAGVARSSAVGTVVNTPRTDLLKGRVEKMLQSFDTRMAGPKPDPSVRDLTSAALTKLFLGQDVSKAIPLLQHMFKLQNMDAASPNFGSVPWQEGHPEINDGNANDFTMLPLGALLLRFGDQLPAEFKTEALAHAKAGIVAVRRRNAGVAYTNIYLMQIANLLLLGEATGDESAVAEANSQLEGWMAFTRKNGITEYSSSTYSAVQIGSLQVAYENTRNAVIKAKMKTCLDYLWTDLAASYYPSLETMVGPQSRDYNFLFGDKNVTELYYLEGLRQAEPGETLLSDDTRIWTNAVAPEDYHPGAAILDIGRLPERTIEAKFGPEPGADRYTLITPDFAVGSASNYHGGQDKQVSVELKSSKELPAIQTVPDDLDAPYGKLKALDKSGHSKPHHLKDFVAAVQHGSTILALLDLSPEGAGHEVETLATNIIFPTKADGVFLDGEKLDTTKAFEKPTSRNSVLVIREGNSAVSLRIFAADGAGGQAPAFTIKYDGNEWGAGRLIVYHYRGAKKKLPPGPIRSGALLNVARCADDAAFQSFLAEAQKQTVELKADGAQCAATARVGDVKLAAAFDPAVSRILYRRVNDKDIEPPVFRLNGKDMVAELLPNP